MTQGGPPDPAPEPLGNEAADAHPMLVELRAIRTELHEGRTLTRQLIGVMMDLRDELSWVRRSAERVERAVQMVEDMDLSARKRADSAPPPPTPIRTNTGG